MFGQGSLPASFQVVFAQAGSKWAVHENQISALLTSQACSSRPLEPLHALRKSMVNQDLLCPGRHGHTSWKKALRAPSGPVFAKASPQRAACERYWLLYSPPRVKRQLCCRAPKRQLSSCALEKSAVKWQKNFVVFPKGKNRGVLIECAYRLTGGSTLQDLFLPCRTSSRVAFWWGILLLKGTFHFFKETFSYD